MVIRITIFNVVIGLLVRKITRRNLLIQAFMSLLIIAMATLPVYHSKEMVSLTEPLASIFLLPAPSMPTLMRSMPNMFYLTPPYSKT